MSSALRSSSIRPVALRLPVVALLVGVLLSLGLVAPGAGSSTAFAATCTCKKAGTAKLIEQADLVVSGTVAAEDDSTKPAQLTLSLDRIYQGTVETSTLTVAQDPACPLTGVSIGARWVILARGAAPQTSETQTPGTQTPTQAPTDSTAADAASGLPASPSSDTASPATTPSTTASSAPTAIPVAIGCNLSGEPTSARMTAVQARFGTGVAPTKPAPPEPTLTKVETMGPDQFRRMAAPGGAMLVIGLLGLLAVRRLGRPRR